VKIYALLLVLSLSVLPVPAQNNRPVESSRIPAVTFCDLVDNPDIFDDREVRFRATYVANKKVGAFVDQSCMAKDKRTWAEFDGISIKDSAPPEMYQKVLEQILCGKCGEDDDWRETEMLVTGVFRGSDIGHGRLGKFRFMVTVRNVEEMGVTVKAEPAKYDLR
jgi:hypothetical protein